MASPDPPSGTLSFVPLEANPPLMTSLLHSLGLSESLQIHDVYSLTDPDLLAFLPRPALALLLVFPVSATYESHRLAEDSLYAPPPPAPANSDESVLWFPQTIRNSCGLMGLLHAALNGPAQDFVEPGSDLHRILEAAKGLDAEGRARLLEKDEGLREKYGVVAEQGDTAAPGKEEEVDLHYVCFVKGKDGGLWELDGRRKGPLKRAELGKGEDVDVLNEDALREGVLKFLEREGGDLRFSAVVLAGGLD
ncbi:putative ubiquitin carboxyl-terminal hydrolase isozyme L3 [Cladorrhinum sp. PSN332]|nr:putative ubiquitin carboxyl-terminal hydrolase isozyme L3 [Cladorrhinum sp. PSN332]